MVGAGHSPTAYCPGGFWLVTEELLLICQVTFSEGRDRSGVKDNQLDLFLRVAS